MKLTGQGQTIKVEPQAAKEADRPPAATDEFRAAADAEWDDGPPANPAPLAVCEMEGLALAGVRALAERARNLTAENGLLRGDIERREQDEGGPSAHEKGWDAGFSDGWDAAEIHYGCSVPRTVAAVAAGAFVLGALVATLILI